MYLETWLHKTIGSRVAGNEDFQRFANLRSDRINREIVEKYQLWKLRETLQCAYDRSSFYRQSFESAGIRPADVVDWKDLSSIPFTEPRHLSESPYRFLCLSQSEIARSHTFVTSGTTGPQKKIFWTEGDLDRIIDFMSAGIGMTAAPGDVVYIMLPDGRPNSQADLLRQGVVKLGAIPFVAGFAADASEHLKNLLQFKSTVVFGYTGRVFRLSKEMQSSCDLRALGVHSLFLAAEYLPAAMRRELQTLWNCPVYTHYGLTEMGLGVAVECAEHDGYHFNEADLLLEIVDPATGETVQPGTEGELVFTTLAREGMPLIRYRTRDLSHWSPQPCSCGARTMRKFAAVKKRLDTIVHTEDGNELYPTLFDDFLFEIPVVVDYQIILSRRGNRDQLDFRVETKDQGHGLVPEILDKISSSPLIARGVALGKMLQPRVQLVNYGTLQAVSRAKKIIVDRRDN
jgi:phenylacetate-CoA ligase